MKQSLLRRLTFCLCYNIVHPSWVKETRSIGNAREDLTANSQDASESHSNVRSYSERKRSQGLVWQFLCSLCFVGDKRPPSQPRTTTIYTNYWTGRFLYSLWALATTHAQFLYLLLIHGMAITTEWERGDDVVWCFLCCSGNKATNSCHIECCPFVSCLHLKES